jgi:hypothetical protein
MNTTETEHNRSTGTHPSHLIEGPIEAFPSVRSALTTTSLLLEEERRGSGEISITCCACSHDFGKAGDSFAVDRCPNCDGRTVRFRVSPESNRHWLRIKEQLAKTAPELREPEPISSTTLRAATQTRWSTLVVAVVLSVIAFFVARHWLYGAPIPLIHKPQEYEFTLPELPTN